MNDADAKAAFANAHPLTFERLNSSSTRKANAEALVGENNFWSNLKTWLEQQKFQRLVVTAGLKCNIAINIADEFGVDQVHILQSDRRFILVRRNQYNVDRYDLAASAFQNQMRPTHLWTVPFQKAVIVQMQNMQTQLRELVWIQTEPPPQAFEMSNWSINHNNLLENPQDFASPANLLGDLTLSNTLPIIAATESRIDVPTAKAALASVTIRQRDTLIFDQVYQEKLKEPPRHWRQLLTEEIWEPKAIPMTSACMVLDSYMLFHSADGVLRAHPRGNPKSTYHVRDLQSAVTHMTSLYNVVAIIHSYDVLEVWRVQKQEDDPFLTFTTVFQARLVDASHPPLLYGPFVIFRLLDGVWIHALYDAPVQQQVEIKIPNMAGWNIMAIKNANWRSLTVTLLNGREEQEFVLTVTDNVIESCIGCESKAEYLCGGCKSVGFCELHKEHEHRHACGREE